jgi:hypothetical protein
MNIRFEISTRCLFVHSGGGHCVIAERTLGHGMRRCIRDQSRVVVVRENDGREREQNAE